jgi:predicted RNA methylase
MTEHQPIPEELLLGQFIPLHYHAVMLTDQARMGSFKTALEYVVPPGGRVLELGGGTGVLSFFAAQKAARVWCVERNPELVDTARRLLALNGVDDRVEVVAADAFDYLPPERVDVVVCEMLHSALLREKQAPLMASFKERYLARFGPPLPTLVPEAAILGIQPVQHSFEFFGYQAPIPIFQDPSQPNEASILLAEPAVTNSVIFRSHFRRQSRGMARCLSRAMAASMQSALSPAASWPCALSKATRSTGIYSTSSCRWTSQSPYRLVEACTSPSAMRRARR